MDDMSYFDNKTENDNEIVELSVPAIKRAMEELPEGNRIIFSLYLLEGYDHREISQILEISESNSKTQYMRARRRIKEILSNVNYK